MASSLPARAGARRGARLAGIRALMVHDEGRRLVRQAELRNSDRKIVVRLVVDEPADAASGEPPTVLVRRLRGLRQGGGPRLGAGDHGARAGGRPGRRPACRRRARPCRPRLTGEGPARRRAAGLPRRDARQPPGPSTTWTPSSCTTSGSRCAGPGRRSSWAGRRCRSEMRSRWEPAFKWLGDLTTPVRDLDVYELELPDDGGLAGGGRRRRPGAVRRAPAPPAHRRAAGPGARAASARLPAAGRRLGAGARRAARRPTPTRRTLPAGAAGRPQHLSEAYRRVVRDGAAISAELAGRGPARAAQAVQGAALRPRGVRAGDRQGRPRKRAVADLKELQDVLGRFQDSEVQRQALRELRRGDDGRRARRRQAVLAMGELVGHLDAEQDRARERVRRRVRPVRAARRASAGMRSSSGGGR